MARTSRRQPNSYRGGRVVGNLAYDARCAARRAPRRDRALREQPRKQWFRRLLRRARNEAVLCASFAAALLSALFVPPDAAYLA